MKSRRQIKATAKDRFLASYWPCVGTVVLMSLALGACGFVPFGALILAGPLAIGMNFFFIELFSGRPQTVGFGFAKAFEGFGRKLGGYLWMLLFEFLWSLLFVIPGIIKSFAYAMTPYILADCPNVRAQDALKLSMRMMRGHKWQLFVFILSYIGWMLLCCIPVAGFVLNVFYVSPFMSAGEAGFYLEVREEALRNGIITMDELNGNVAVA